MIKIADITSTSDPIDVTNIPQNYNSLIIFVFVDRDPSVGRVPYLKFNGDSTNHGMGTLNPDWNSGYYGIGSLAQIPLFHTDRFSPSVAWLEIPNYTSSAIKVGTSFAYHGDFNGTASNCESHVRKITYAGGAITSMRFFGPFSTTSPRVKKITIYGV